MVRVAPSYLDDFVQYEKLSAQSSLLERDTVTSVVHHSVRALGTVK